MAKKKKVINLQQEKISYEENGFIYKLKVFKTDIQKIEVAVYDKDDTFIENKIIAFAHIPKAVKGKIKPL